MVIEMENEGYNPRGVGMGVEWMYGWITLTTSTSSDIKQCCCEAFVGFTPHHNTTYVAGMGEGEVDLVAINCPDARALAAAAAMSSVADGCFDGSVGVGGGDDGGVAASAGVVVVAVVVVDAAAAAPLELCSSSPI